MKIAIVNNIYFPEGRGGGEMVAKHRALEFANAGNDVFIIVPGEKYVQIKVNEHLTLIRFKPIHLFMYKNAKNFSWSVRLIWHVLDMFNIATYFQIKKILKELTPDSIEVHNLKGIGFFIPSVAKALKIPLTMYLHDVQLSIPSGILISGEEKRWINSGFLQKLYEKTLKSLVGSPENVISPSAWLLKYYIDKGFFKESSKTTLSIDQEKVRISEMERKLILISKKIKHSEEIYVAFVGKLETYKGISFLLEVWRTLPSNFVLKIYGEGSLLDNVRMEKKRGSNIELFGYLHHAELLPAIKSADLLIMPTLCYENRPEVILEAFNVGTPVIASNLGGVSELLKDNKRGLLYKPGDGDALKNIFLEQLKTRSY